MASLPKLDRASNEAIQWLVRLRSGRATPNDHADFSSWQSRDSSNGQAWERLERAVGSSFAKVREVDGRLPGQAREAREVLLRPGRRMVLRSLIAATVGAGALALGDRLHPLEAFTADLHTGTGERRTLTLQDGSVLTLNARSLVDVSFTNGERRLLLRQGELVVQVAPDAMRPFVVATRDGQARALGTRFVVRRDESSTVVSVLEHRVAVLTTGGVQDVLEDGEGATFNGDRIVRARPGDAASDAWTKGQLVVNRRPLAEVIEELQHYRRGVLWVSPQVANVMVQGVFPLDDVHRALLGLADTLPITVTHYGPWLTRITPR